MDLKALAYGLAAHLILGWALLFFLPPKNHSPKPIPIPVKIKFEEKPAVPLETVAKPGSTRDRAPPAPKSERETPVAAAPAKPVYTDLIPKATTGQIALPAAGVAAEESLIEGHQFKEGSSGSTRQKLVIDASTLSAAFDVPLRIRRDSAGMEAFVRLERRDVTGLRIIDLRGDPMVRAVIFENLQDPKVARLILKLMDELEEKTLPITLRVIPGAQGDRMQEELDFSWIGRKLVIRKSAPPQSRGPGITLPDEDAKKAIIRDRLEFERYQRSPAYRSAIQNFDVPSP